MRRFGRPTAAFLLAPAEGWGLGWVEKTRNFENLKHTSGFSLKKQIYELFT